MAGYVIQSSVQICVKQSMECCEYSSGHPVRLSWQELSASVNDASGWLGAPDVPFWWILGRSGQWICKCGCAVGGRCASATNECLLRSRRALVRAARRIINITQRDMSSGGRSIVIHNGNVNMTRWQWPSLAITDCFMDVYKVLLSSGDWISLLTGVFNTYRSASFVVV